MSLAKKIMTDLMEIGAKERLKVKRYTFLICGEFTDRESTRIIDTTYW